MIDPTTRNNWIIIIVITAATLLVTSNIVSFNVMLTDVANHINVIVNNTGKNMTYLTSQLIKEQKREINITSDVVNNQTKQFISGLENVTSNDNIYQAKIIEKLDNISKNDLIYRNKTIVKFENDIAYQNYILEKYGLLEELLRNHTNQTIPK